MLLERLRYVKNVPNGILPTDPLLDETVLFKTVIGFKGLYEGPAKMFLERYGKTICPGILRTDPLLDETVSFKTVTGLKGMIWGSGKIAF